MKFLINALIVIVIAIVIGEERAHAGKEVGFRSIALTMLGAYTFTYLSCNSGKVIDYHVIANIVTGISFVGAGMIFKDGGIRNLTTAITIWTSTAIGILVGLNMILEAITLAILVLLILLYNKK